MKKIISIVLIAIILIASAISIGISLKNNKNENVSTKEITTVRLNEVTRSVFYSPQYIAINNGYFEEENIKIELTTGQGADKVMTAVLASQSDIGFARTGSCNICI